MAQLTPNWEAELDELLAQEVEAQPIDPDPRRLWPHGYSVRVRLKISRDEAVAALGALEWSPAARTSRWTPSTLKGNVRRWTLRGSTFVTQRKPTNGKLAMARFNSTWKTVLYSIQIELHPGDVFLDLHGVRHDDIESVLQRTMKLQPQDYEIAYYRALERYFVLDPPEAHRLAEALDGRFERGRGRLARKTWLLREYEVPLKIRNRRPRVATLSIYRIERGATAKYKCELRLAGQARNRDQFLAEDAGVLDAFLWALIDEHGVSLSAKPARWEPAGRHGWRRDPLLARLGQAAYRGSRVGRDLQHAVDRCHTPGVFLVGNFQDVAVTSASREYIRSSIPSPIPHEDSSQRQEERGEPEVHQREGCDGGSKEQPDSIPPPMPRPSRSKRSLRERPMWTPVVKDILRFPGFLSEVILDDAHDPGPLLESLVDGAPEGSVGVEALTIGGPTGSNSWTSVTTLAHHHPVTEKTTTYVLVIDPSVVGAVSNAVSVFDEKTGHLVDGPLVRPWDHNTDMFHLASKAVGAWLFGMLGELRDICEHGGLRVILVTPDTRPDHGRGAMLRTHYFRDGRVRSLLGDAGRYHAHNRYLVEVDRNVQGRRVVMLKDEGEGLMGRVLWSRSYDSWGLDD